MKVALSIGQLAGRWLYFIYWDFLHVYAFMIGPLLLLLSVYFVPCLFPLILAFTFSYGLFSQMTRPLGIFVGFCITGFPLVIAYVGIALGALFGSLQLIAKWLLL